MNYREMENMQLVDEVATIAAFTRNDHYEPDIISKYWYDEITYERLIDSSNPEGHFKPLVFAVVQSAAVGKVYAMPLDDDSELERLFSTNDPCSCLLFKDRRDRYYFRLWKQAKTPEEAARAKAENQLVKNLIKGGVKSIPVIGGILEEGIFGTLEDLNAAEESAKLLQALSDLRKTVEEQNSSVIDILSMLKENSTISKNTRTLVESLECGIVKHSSENFPIDAQPVINEYLKRATASRDDTRVDDVEGRLNLVQRLTKLTNDDFNKIVAAIPDAVQQISEYAPIATRVWHLVRWADSGNGPGLARVQEVYDHFFGE